MAGQRPRIPVSIITGFLGAGKTTLLNHLLRQRQDVPNVVIENEFGSVGIDGALVRQYSNEVYEVSNGCICCSLDDELFDILAELAREEEAPGHLFIEATGIADSGSLAATFLRPDIRKRFELRPVICVVDSTNLTERLSSTQEAGQQIASADVLVLNKTGLATTEALQAAAQAVKLANPLARIIQSADGRISATELDLPRVRPEVPFVLPKAKPALPKVPVHTATVASSHTFDRPFDLSKIKHVLSVSLMLYAKQIFRVKGIVQSPDGQWHLLQSTGKQVEITPLAPGAGAGPSTIVVIGQGVKEEAVARLLRQGLA